MKNCRFKPTTNICCFFIFFSSLFFRVDEDDFLRIDKIIGKIFCFVLHEPEDSNALDFPSCQDFSIFTTNCHKKKDENLRYWHKYFLQSCSCWVLGRSRRDSLWTKCKGSKKWRVGDISCGRVQRHPMPNLERCSVALNTCRDFRAVHDHWSERRSGEFAWLHSRDLYIEAIEVIQEPQTCGGWEREMENIKWLLDWITFMLIWCEYGWIYKQSFVRILNIFCAIFIEKVCDIFDTKFATFSRQSS